MIVSHAKDVSGVNIGGNEGIKSVNFPEVGG